MSTCPLVSVALPCHNAQTSVGEAVESLLTQTYGELEIIAVDDGSTDETGEILASYAARDTRLRLLRHESNRGLIATLNHAVADACGEFVARMDADDVAAPRRIETQVEFLSRRPDVGVVGCAIDLVALGSERPPRPRPLRCHEPRGARFMSILGTPVAHTSILARTNVMKAHPYGLVPEAVHTEDYELFSRMISTGVGFANIDEPLVTVRLDPGGISRRYEKLQVDNFVRCAHRHFERIFGWLPDTGPHRVLVNRLDASTTRADLADGLRLLSHVEHAFVESEPSAYREIRGIADMQRVDILLQAVLKGQPSLRTVAGREGLRYAKHLSSPTARGYLASKFRR